jgi:hypothetical protein
VEVRHKSRGKNSSDETLRQEMRKLEDLSTEAGRIVLISGHPRNTNYFLSVLWHNTVGAVYITNAESITNDHFAAIFPM